MEQGYKVQVAKALQDNNSTVTLAHKGRPTSNRTRRVAMRYFFVKVRIENKEIEMVYETSENMAVDYFTKPLQGELFRKHRNTS